MRGFIDKKIISVYITLSIYSVVMTLYIQAH